MMDERDAKHKASLVDQLFVLLPWRQRVKIALLIALSIGTAAIETAGIASTMPFLAVLAAPESLENNKLLAQAYAYFGAESRQQFLWILGVLSFIGFVSGTACRLLNNWGQIRFNRSVEYALACRLMTDYVRRPYAFFLGRNNADLSKMVLSEVGQVVSNFITPIMTLVSTVIVTSFLLALLCFVSPKLALGTTAAIGAAYAILFLSLRRWIVRVGQLRFKSNQARFEAANEVFGGIKEIKLLGNEPAYLQRFSKAFSQVARAQALAGLASSMPAYGLQLVAFGGGLLLALLFLQDPKDLARALPVIALCFMCARRMLPSIQSIFKNLVLIRFSQPAVNRLLEDLQESEYARADMQAIDTPLPFAKDIVLEKVSFAYPGAAKSAIDQIDIDIPFGSRVGFVGKTGSGKTTTADIILGLLGPTRGRMLVDGVAVCWDNIRQWQANLGYVPQQIYLADDTVMGNIALGIPRKKIDMGAVERAARLACIHDFVVDETEHGYMTMLGERGVRLSGGQRQRIGIARALYRNPKILLFDEATSALDNATEKIVMQGLQSLGRDRTMIFIAHRLSTVRDVDMIYLFARGRIIACGNFDELTDGSTEFQSLHAHGS